MHKQWQAIQRVFQQYLRVFRLVWQASPRYTGMVLGLTVIGSLAAPAQIWLVKVIIDRVGLLLRITSANFPINNKTKE